MRSLAPSHLGSHAGKCPSKNGRALPVGVISCYDLYQLQAAIALPTVLLAPHFDSDGGPVRYRTALILSLLLIAAMVVVPAIANSLAHRYLEQGDVALSAPTRIFFGIAAFCLSFRFLFVPPIVGMLIFIAALTSGSRRGK